MSDQAASISPDHPLTGGCFCGALKYALSAPPKMSGYCHCTQCQRLNGARSPPTRRASNSALTPARHPSLSQDVPSCTRSTSQRPPSHGHPPPQTTATSSTTRRSLTRRVCVARRADAASRRITPKRAVRVYGARNWIATERDASYGTTRCGLSGIYSMGRGSWMSGMGWGSGRDIMIYRCVWTSRNVHSANQELAVFHDHKWCKYIHQASRGNACAQAA